MVQTNTGIWSSILKQASKLSGDHSASDSERRAEAALLVQAVSAAALLRKK